MPLFFSCDAEFVSHGLSEIGEGVGPGQGSVIARSSAIQETKLILRILSLKNLPSSSALFRPLCETFPCLYLVIW